MKETVSQEAREVHGEVDYIDKMLRTENEKSECCDRVGQKFVRCEKTCT